ncbi:hypothetical protein [Psychroserpens sp. SPM9]|nr:hypothetical protein [Psychroserpens sp. SPM9]MDG5490633.1 hypothetical protein [Psychroserpens sp. SPM9]
MPAKITVTGANAGVLDYVYSADGIKLQKKKTVGGNVTTTDYADNFLYENGILKQFYHPEGYVEPDGNSYRYVYQYTDIWNNVRISYSDFNNNGAVTSSEIIQERNFYPFGLEHKGYNNNVISENNYQTYQDQELNKDLGLNVHEWKYRISDPAIGRFWQIDPLAEKYVYNSTYAFQENKLGSGIELEGLENTGFDMRQRYRDKQLLKGKMTQEQYLEQSSAEGKGAIAALTIISPIDEVTIIGGAAIKYGGPLLKAGFKALGKLFGKSDEVSDAAKILAKNKDIGTKGENLITESLGKEFKGDEILTQVTGKFEDGTKVRFDNVVVDPKTGKIKLVNETKTGNAKLSKQQERFFNGGESVELVGKNAGGVKGQTISNSTTQTRATTVDRKLLEEQ